MFSDNFDLKKIVTFIAIFSVTYIISGILTPAVADMTLADMWNGLGNSISSASASIK